MQIRKHKSRHFRKSRNQSYFLNGQLINLLSTLGVRDNVLERKQREGVVQLDAILTDPLWAHEALELMSSGENTNVLEEKPKRGCKPEEEPSLTMMLQTFRASNPLELRTRTRIFVQNGRAVIGIGSGKWGCCSKSVPAPGDMHALKAVNVPALHHMLDSEAFPAEGERPRTDECSRGDLDGDAYFVCWSHVLIPSLQFPPMDYTPASKKVLDHDVPIKVYSSKFIFNPPTSNFSEHSYVEEYFVDYTVNDSLASFSMLMSHMVLVHVSILFNGELIEQNDEYKFKGSKAKGIMIPRSTTYAALVEKITEVIDIDTSEFEITMKFKLKTYDPMPPVTVQTNDDVEFF
ncbi:hypothetical protein KPL70_024786 [Citrus sinensis]|nr:hypothetical protein KPL70_024786 [Citrus sinensis]